MNSQLVEDPKSAKFGKIEEVEQVLKEMYNSMTKEEMENELYLVETWNHEWLRRKENEFARRTVHASTEIAINDKIDEIRIISERKRREENIAAEKERKVKELRDKIRTEIEELERRYEVEYACTEVNKQQNMTNISLDKKLRHRGGGGPLVEPPTYFNAQPKNAIYIVQSTANYLLEDWQIAQDLEEMPKMSQRIDVHLQKQKIIYDGRSYKQGEDVIVENMQYGKMQARIETVQDTVVYFKASQSWDIRQVHATLADLMEGRVKVYKGQKKNT